MKSYASACLPMSMKLVGEALKNDAQGKQKEAYCQYLSSMHYIIQSLKDDAWETELRNLEKQETQKLFKLLQKCLERSEDIFSSQTDETRGAAEAQVPASLGKNESTDGQAARHEKSDNSRTNPTPGALSVPCTNRFRSLSDFTSPGSSSFPTGNLNRLIMSMPSPPTANTHQTFPQQRKRSTDRNRIINRRDDVNFNLRAHRRSAENMVIQKIKQQAVEKKLQERRDLLKQEAERRFAQISQRREDNREFKKDVYTKILEFEQEEDWTKPLRQSLTNNTNDDQVVKQVISTILRCKDHPLGKLVAEIQYKIYQMTVQVVNGYSCPAYDFNDTKRGSSGTEDYSEVRDQVSLHSRASYNDNVFEPKSPASENAKPDSDTVLPDPAGNVVHDCNNSTIVDFSRNIEINFTNDDGLMTNLAPHAPEASFTRKDSPQPSTDKKDSPQLPADKADSHQPPVTRKDSPQPPVTRKDSPQPPTETGIEGNKDNDTVIRGTESKNRDSLLSLKEITTSDDSFEKAYEDLEELMLSDNTKILFGGSSFDECDDNESTQSAVSDVTPVSNEYSRAFVDGDLTVQNDVNIGPADRTMVDDTALNSSCNTDDTTKPIPSPKSRIDVQDGADDAHVGPSASRDDTTENNSQEVSESESHETASITDNIADANTCIPSIEVEKVSEESVTAKGKNDDQPSFVPEAESDELTVTRDLDSSEANDISSAGPSYGYDSPDNVSKISSSDASKEEEGKMNALKHTEELNSGLGLGPTPTQGSLFSVCTCPDPSNQQSLKGRTWTQENQDKLNEIVREVHVSLDLLYSLLLITYRELDKPNGHDSCYSSLESVFFEPVWPWLSLLFRKCNEEKEFALFEVMKQKRLASIDDFSVREKFQLISDEDQVAVEEPYLEAIEELRLVPTYLSPLEKLECSVRASRLIITAVEEYWEKGKGTKAPSVGCDDLLPILTYVIVKAGQPQIISECHALEEFIHESYLMGEEGYCLTTLQTALVYLISLVNKAE